MRPSSAPSSSCGVDAAEAGLVAMVDLAEYEAGFMAGPHPEKVVERVAGASGSGAASTANRRAFERWWLLPRVMTDVSEIKMDTTVLGRQVRTPILLAPTGNHGELHEAGELATARAAADCGTIIILSAASSASMETVVAEFGPGAWQQLFVWKDRGMTRDMVSRAEAHGFGALCVTVDSPRRARRPHELRTGGPVDPGYDDAFTWQDLEWLRSLSDLPLVLKGIMVAEDAVRAASCGAAGVYVSNHGGRQLDSAPGTLDVLPAIVDAVAGSSEVYLDGGIRTGSDVVKALSLGARAVAVGRPVLWGLGMGGAGGVRAVLDLLTAETENTLALIGCTDVATADRSVIAKCPGGGPVTQEGCSC